MKKKGKGSFLVFNGGDDNQKKVTSLENEVQILDKLNKLKTRLENFDHAFISRASKPHKDKNLKNIQTYKLKNCEKNHCYLIYNTDLLTEENTSYKFNFEETVKLDNHNSQPNDAKFTIKNLLELKKKIDEKKIDISKPEKIKETISPEVYYVLSFINYKIANSFLNSDKSGFDINEAYKHLSQVYSDDNHNEDEDENKEYYMKKLDYKHSNTEMNNNNDDIVFADSDKKTEVLDQTKSRIYIYAKYLNSLLNDNISAKLDKFLYLNPQRRGTEEELIQEFDKILQNLKNEIKKKKDTITTLKKPKYTLPVLK